MFANNVRQIINKHRFLAVLHGIGVFVFLTIFDQGVKKMVIVTHGSYMCNDGMAFSIHLPSITFVIAWMTIMAIVLYNMMRTDHNAYFEKISYLLIFSGAVGNVIDRFLYGCVIDYLPFFHLTYFNLADVFITAGAIMIMFRTMRS